MEQRNFALQQALAQAGLDNQQIAQMMQAWGLELGGEALNIDRERLGEERRQYNASHGLDWVRTLNDMLMGRLQYGLNLGGLEQAGQNQLIQWLYGGAR